MLFWISLVVAAQFLNALTVLGDKFLVSNKALRSPVVYAFYTSILSGVVLFMLPFGLVSMPDYHILLLSLVVAVSYIISILCLYTTLKNARASEVIPMVGAITAIATFVIRYMFFDQQFTLNFFIGILLLVIGMVLISHYDFEKKIFFYILISGIFFATSSVIVKYIFDLTDGDFANGFFWTRMANVVGALALLLIPGNVSKIFKGSEKSTSNTTILLLSNKVVAAIAFILILYAINIGDVAVVNSLTGLQFVFLFIFALFFTKQFPHYFGEDTKWKGIIHKTMAICIILLGFFVLFI